MNKPIKTVVQLTAANDNGVEGGTNRRSEIAVVCQLPRNMGRIEGEADLIAQFFGDLLQQIANDNEPETGKNPLNTPSSEDPAP